MTNKEAMKRIAELRAEIKMLQQQMKKPSYVCVSKDRFKRYMGSAGYSEKRFGLLLESEGIIAYRSLQRNLHTGRMKRLVLERCSEYLGCLPEDLMGEKS